ncbi:FCS-Like Zinc finger 8-like, partial [Bidens hawaiensis]|uniref:FCS-Like Zinc finger 8-like n=1 Tax=Bidens hawaiensis TaxID=980011 RepID=UPI00404AEBDC
YGWWVGLGILAHIHIEQQEEEEDEEYTIVTRHLPNDNSYRKVVYDGNGKTTIFDISPAPARVDHTKADDFLSCCHQCNKQLDGRDVYMYSVQGERAFCSIECRCMEIWMEERNCSSQASSYSCDMYSSATDTTGIFAI